MWVRIIFGLTVPGILSLAASAHHSVTGNFDAGTTIEVEGEITGIRWRNPHVAFTLTAINDSGEEEQWDIETHSLSIMRRMDVVEPFIEVGDRVRVAGWPALRSTHGMFVNNMLLPSGEEFVFHFTPEPADLRCRTGFGAPMSDGSASRAIHPARSRVFSASGARRSRAGEAFSGCGNIH